MQVQPRVILQSTESIAEAERAGIEATSGDIIAFVDDDAWPPPDWLHWIANSFDDRNVGVVGGPEMAGGPAPNAITFWGTTTRNSGANTVKAFRGCNMAILRAAITPLMRGLPDYSFRWELDLCWGAQELGYAARFVRDAWVKHPIEPRPDSFSTSAIYEFEIGHTMIMLRHLNWAWRTIFLVHTLLVGDVTTPGAIRHAVRVMRGDRDSKRNLLLSYRGKVRGLTRWLSEVRS
jgi:GT2 family glycosyltransferase